MKKIMSFFASTLFLVSGIFTLASCNKSDDNKLKIVSTIFPQYSWVNELTKDNSNIKNTYLINKGTDLHSFQPSVDDMVMISNCDLFIYVGGESDNWVVDALKNASNKNRKTINLLETLGDKAKEEEDIEGVEGEEEEEQETEYDEHVWLSIRNASFFCEKICEALVEIDIENKSLYEQNLAEYQISLTNLDNSFSKEAEKKNKDTLIFGDRFPFRYFTDDYGLNYYAAFKGCSSESEASFKTIVFLANKVDELGIEVILTIEGGNTKIAEAIINQTTSKNQKIRSMNSLQSVTQNQVKSGATYLSLMEGNLASFRDAIK